MLIKNDKFWINVSFNNEGSERNVWRAFESLQIVHNWTINYLNVYFLENRSLPPYQRCRKELNKIIRKERLYRHTQRYSIERVAEKSFPYFSQQRILDDQASYFSLEYQNQLLSVMPDRILEIQIRSRNVWRKYLAAGGGLTTTYGVIFLEGDWKKSLRDRAGDIPLDLFPFLWHSIDLKHDETENNWKIRFRFHAEKSKQGEMAREELEKEFG